MLQSQLLLRDANDIKSDSCTHSVNNSEGVLIAIHPGHLLQKINNLLPKRNQKAPLALS